MPAPQIYYTLLFYAGRLIFEKASSYLQALMLYAIYGPESIYNTHDAIDADLECHIAYRNAGAVT